MQMNDSSRTSRTIEFLSDATQSKLRSTQILTSLPQIVSELVQNALDAGASHVDVGVDTEEWECWVRDDGSGIGRDGLDAIANTSDHMSRRYNTSKAYTPASLDDVTTFGFRGEALASAADLCCLEISSRTSRSIRSWSVILKGGQTLYNGASTRWRRESPGTVVCIRDAFYSLPVRRLAHPSPSKTIELIRKDIEAFALISPEVAFSLENTHKAKERDPNRARVLTVPKTSSSLTVFRHIYGRALAENVDIIDETFGEMKLRGFISLEGASSKAYQFLYVNRRLMSACNLHRIIDSKVHLSSFGKHAYDEYGDTNALRSATRRSPRKTEKKLVYVLNLTIPRKHVDNCLEPAKTSVHFHNTETVSAFLGGVIEAFLQRHGFVTLRPLRPQEGKGADSCSPSPRKRRKIDIAETPNAIRSPPAHLSRRRHLSPLVVHNHLNLDNEQDMDQELVWTDPATGETFVVDPRTGNSYPQHTNLVSTEDPSNTTSETINTTRGRRTLATRTHTEDAVPDWILTALKGNTSYALPEKRVHALPLSSEFPAHACHAHTQSTQRKLTEGTVRPQRFSREDLRSATILGQVDRKFIACTFADGTLVLIDQHAADERVRVERFLARLCEGFLGVERADVRELDPAVPVLLARREAERIWDAGEVRAAFARWGVRFQEESGELGRGGGGAGDQSGFAQVFVIGVPDIVGSKLLAGDELRDFIKGYLAKLESEGTPAPPSSQPHDSSSTTQREEARVLWQKALRWCPQELLELVNSKACRGAIMFNDTLTMEQCQRLVSQLADTALPFQCAHGRPSLVPLTDVSAFAGKDEAGRPAQVDWTQFAGK